MTLFSLFFSIGAIIVIGPQACGHEMGPMRRRLNLLIQITIAVALLSGLCVGFSLKTDTLGYSWDWCFWLCLVAEIAQLAIVAYSVQHVRSFY